MLLSFLEGLRVNRGKYIDRIIIVFYLLIVGFNNSNEINQSSKDDDRYLNKLKYTQTIQFNFCR